MVIGKSQHQVRESKQNNYWSTKRSSINSPNLSLGFDQMIGFPSNVCQRKSSLVQVPNINLRYYFFISKIDHKKLGPSLSFQTPNV